METTPIFMGYGSIEALLDGRDPAATQLYLFSGALTTSTRYANFHSRAYYLVLSFCAEGAVHYCRLSYGGAQVVSDHLGRPVPDCVRELARLESRGDSLESLLKAYVVSRHFALPREASPTFPETLQLISGDQHFARLNEDKTAYVPIPAEEVRDAQQ